MGSRAAKLEPKVRHTLTAGGPCATISAQGRSAVLVTASDCAQLRGDFCGVVATVYGNSAQKSNSAAPAQQAKRKNAHQHSADGRE